MQKDPQKFLLSAYFQEQSAPGELSELQGEKPQAAAFGDVDGEGTSLSGTQGPSGNLSVSRGGPNNRPVKRQRTSGAHGQGVIVDRRQPAFEMRMTLRQESAGSFVIFAALQQEQLADTAAAAAFTAKCHAIHQDIEQLLLSMQ